MYRSPNGQHPRVLILTLHHGSTHVRISRALEKGLLHLRPNLKVEVVDALAHCAPWFRAYYNSYEIPLKYWPGLWDYIERHQFEGETSGPWWLYRLGARPLVRFIEAFAPDVVVATEVGLGEIAVIHKRETGAQYSLVAMGTFSYERPWAQPEVDLFVSYPGEDDGDERGARDDHAGGRQRRRPARFRSARYYHFFEANPALKFERAHARGFRLDSPGGNAIRFEPGQKPRFALWRSPESGRSSGSGKR